MFVYVCVLVFSRYIPSLGRFSGLLIFGLDCIVFVYLLIVLMFCLCCIGSISCEVVCDFVLAFWCLVFVVVLIDCVVLLLRLFEVCNCSFVGLRVHVVCFVWVFVGG